MLWLVPLYLRCAYYGFLFLCDFDSMVVCLVIVPTIIYELALPALCVIFCVLCPVLVGFQGIYCGIDTYNHGLGTAIGHNAEGVYEITSAINKFIFTGSTN